MYREGFPQ